MLAARPGARGGSGSGGAAGPARLPAALRRRDSIRSTKSGRHLRVGRRIAEEEAAVERLKEKERIALEYAGKAPAEEVVGEEGCGAGEGKAQKSDEVTE